MGKVCIMCAKVVFNIVLQHDTAIAKDKYIKYILCTCFEEKKNVCNDIL